MSRDVLSKYFVWGFEESFAVDQQHVLAPLAAMYRGVKSTKPGSRINENLANGMIASVLTDRP